MEAFIALLIGLGAFGMSGLMLEPPPPSASDPELAAVKEAPRDRAALDCTLRIEGADAVFPPTLFFAAAWREEVGGPDPRGDLESDQELDWVDIGVAADVNSGDGEGITEGGEGSQGHSDVARGYMDGDETEGTKKIKNYARILVDFGAA